MTLFNHVQIKVKNIEKSMVFYNAIMQSLGYIKVLTIPGQVVGYGTNVHDMFEIRQSDDQFRLSQSVHIAFNALTKLSVDIFYDVALANGGICNGKPGLRPEYASNYYAAFVLDLDGNNIEAVFCAH